MPRYRVCVRVPLWDYYEVVVEAPDPDHAMSLAEEKLRFDEDFDHHHHEVYQGAPEWGEAEADDYELADEDEEPDAVWQGEDK